MALLFGTAGPPESTANKSSEAGVLRVREIGLDCMEVLFVQGVRMGGATAADVRDAATDANVLLSCHAPYAINLASYDKAKRTASENRIFEAARVGALCGGDNVVFHPGYFGDLEHKDVFSRILESIIRVRKKMDEEGLEHVTLRPEITGKPSQFGDLDDTINICSEAPRTLPCIDFSHLFTRSIGECNSYDCFAQALEKIQSKLGRSSIQNLHIHLSGIEYGPKGERRHLPMRESKMRYTELIQALVDFDAGGRVICESPDEYRENDALLYRKYYRRRLTETGK